MDTWRTIEERARAVVIRCPGCGMIQGSGRAAIGGPCGGCGVRVMPKVETAPLVGRARRARDDEEV